MRPPNVAPGGWATLQPRQSIDPRPGTITAAYAMAQQPFRTNCAPAMKSRRSRPATPSHQRGQALILTALLVIVGFGALLFNSTALVSNSIANQQAKNAEIELAKVRDALIGWSASRTPPLGGANARPGDLPCPDMNNDGFEDGSCVAGAIGRMPWKTLNIPEPKDSSAETLWYAIAGPFRNYNMNTASINSDTVGNLTLYVGSSATTLTSQAIAVIFSPGASLGAQNRDPSTNALCATTGTTIARNLCAANYLEATGGGNNAQTGGPFIQAQSSGTFNDRPLVITNADLMPVVEPRVARELRTILQNYKANTACACTNLGGTAGCYPWADLSNGTSDAPPYDIGQGNNRGRVPALGASPYNWGANPCGSAVPTLPSWFVDNDWRLVVYYSAGRNFLGPGACTTCADPTLTVTGDAVPMKEVVILMPGPLLGAPPRAPVPLDDSTYWQYYFEDAANRDFANDFYIIPTSTAYTRDRIFAIP